MFSEQCPKCQELLTEDYLEYYCCNCKYTLIFTGDYQLYCEQFLVEDYVVDAGFLDRKCIVFKKMKGNNNNSYYNKIAKVDFYLSPDISLEKLKSYIMLA